MNNQTLCLYADVKEYLLMFLDHHGGLGLNQWNLHGLWDRDVEWLPSPRDYDTEDELLKCLLLSRWLFLMEIRILYQNESD